MNIDHDLQFGLSLESHNHLKQFLLNIGSLWTLCKSQTET